VAEIMQRLDWITRPALGLATRLRHATPPAYGQLVDLLYPPQCSWCKDDIPAADDDIALCDDCRILLAPPITPCCCRCSAAISYVPGMGEDCIHCRWRQYRFKRVVALANYRKELRKAIWDTKYTTGEVLAQAFAKLLLQRRMESLKELNADIVVPVSMHWLRRLRRGANGPEIMAAALARGLRLPLAAGALRRTKLTPRQSESTLKQRLVNQRGSFKVRGRKQIRGRRILLVDDVLTTGATCNAATKALLSAGAAAVVVAVIARAVGDDAL
jgi:ComF family protein